MGCTEASVALDGCGAGAAGTGLSHWANSKQQHSLGEGVGFKFESQLLKRGGLWVELDPHSKVLSCGPGRKHLLGALPL